jgi:hypothetical protein
MAIGSCATPVTEPSFQAATPKTLEPLLNSERIRQRFGSYGIDVVRESESLRVSNLYSIEGGNKITRTLAVVIYAMPIPGMVMAEHGEIKHGHSIGEVFGRHGWSIAKENAYFGEIVASPALAGVYASMGGIGEVNLAVHVYKLSVGKNGAWTDYATIAEVHQPDYLGLEKLHEIYGGAAAESGLNRRDIQNVLELVTEALENY